MGGKGSGRTEQRVIKINKSIKFYPKQFDLIKQDAKSIGLSLPKFFVKIWLEWRVRKGNK